VATITAHRVNSDFTTMFLPLKIDSKVQSLLATVFDF